MKIRKGQFAIVILAAAALTYSGAALAGGTPSSSALQAAKTVNTVAAASSPPSARTAELASSASKRKRRCGEYSDGWNTVATTKTLRVYWDGARVNRNRTEVGQRWHGYGGDLDFFVCRFKKPNHSVPLNSTGENLRREIYPNIAMGGNYVAFLTFDTILDRDEDTPNFEYITRVSAKTGTRKKIQIPKLKNIQVPLVDQVSPFSIQVARSGSIAYGLCYAWNTPKCTTQDDIDRNFANNPGAKESLPYELHPAANIVVQDKKGLRYVDAGEKVNPYWVRIRGKYVYWRNAGVLKKARIY